MKILILFFMLFSNVVYADDWTKADFDFGEYLLQGDARESLEYRYSEPAYDRFMMRDGYIIFSMYTDMGYDLIFELFPSGEYEFITDKGTEIKIIVDEKSLVKEFYFKGSKEDFESKEKNINKNLCEEGLSYYLYNNLLKKIREIDIIFKDDEENISSVVFKYKNHIMFFFYDGESGFDEFVLNKEDLYHARHYVDKSYYINMLTTDKYDNKKISEKKIMTLKECSLIYLDDNVFKMEYRDTKEKVVLPNENL